jgi:transposase
MEAALVGDYRPEHLFVLGQSLQAYRFYQARTQECDCEIEGLLQQLAERFESTSALRAELSLPDVLNDAPSQNPRPAKSKVKRKPQANEPKIDLAGYLRRICGVDLTQVIGLNVLSVLLIVSEIGVDMSKWRSAKAFCSRLGLCPRNKISGRKVLDTRTCKVINTRTFGEKKPHIGFCHEGELELVYHKDPGLANLADSGSKTGIFDGFDIASA